MPLYGARYLERVEDVLLGFEIGLARRHHLNHRQVRLIPWQGGQDEVPAVLIWAAVLPDIVSAFVGAVVVVVAEIVLTRVGVVGLFEVENLILALAGFLSGASYRWVLLPVLALFAILPYVRAGTAEHAALACAALVFYAVGLASVL
jgi:hypothetical protein